MLIHPDRLFPAEPGARRIARRLYEQVRSLPIVSPHGHTQAAWFASNEPFPDPAKLLVQPDHYIFRMLYSQGVSLEDLEIGQPGLKNARNVWRIFASHYYLFRGTPTRMWLDFAFQELFGLEQRPWCRRPGTGGNLPSQHSEWLKRRQDTGAGAAERSFKYGLALIRNSSMRSAR